MNAIIKQTVRSNSTLCELAECLSKYLISEIQWERFYQYRLDTTNSDSLSIEDPGNL